MTMKIPKQYLVLGGITIALVIVFILMVLKPWDTLFGQNVPALSQIAKDGISKIVFSAQGAEITLEKDKNNKWFMEPMKYPVDKSTIDSMLSNIADLQLVELISDKKIYDRYSLDEQAKIPITVFTGDKIARAFDVGKTTEIATFTFVKLKDDPNVYSAKGNIKAVFDKKTADIRDKVVISVTRDEINEFILEDGTKTVHIKKETKQKEIAPSEDNKEENEKPPEIVWKSDLSDTPVADSVINELFDGMANLTCEEYIEGKTRADFEGKPFYYRITAKGAKDYVLSYMDKGVDNKYTAISSENDHPALVIGWKVTKVTRKFEKGEVK